MESRNAEMQDIFGELSERNKDIIILIAKSVKVAQEVTEQSCKPSTQKDQSPQKKYGMKENTIPE